MYTFIIYHSKLNPNFGTEYTDMTSTTKEEATKRADKIVERLQAGKKPRKGYGVLTHTEIKEKD